MCGEGTCGCSRPCSALIHKAESVQPRGPVIEGRCRLAAPGAVDVKDQGINEIRAAYPVIFKRGPHFVMAFDDPVVAGERAFHNSPRWSRANNRTRAQAPR
jgi:hypothetical protein